MRSKRRSFRMSYRRRGNSVLKNIAARVAAHVFLDNLLRRRSRRSRRYSSGDIQMRSRRSRNTNNNTMKIIAGVIASYIGYKLYSYYYYRESRIEFGSGDGFIEIAGNLMKSDGILLGVDGYDITRIKITKNGKTVYVSSTNGNENKKFIDNIDYQLSSDGQYYKFGELKKPYFYVYKNDLNKIINFLQK